MENGVIIWVEYTKRSSEMTAKGLSLDTATQKPMITLMKTGIPVIIRALWEEWSWPLTLLLTAK